MTAIIILPADTVDEAHSRMIQRGVRLLLVVDENRNVLGVVTATDILGEKPVQVAVQRGSRRGEIQVRDIMTPQERIEVLDMAAVRGAKVGHVVATLRKAGRQHAVVVERDRQGRQTVRGLFSATQIARQLGVEHTDDRGGAYVLRDRSEPRPLARELDETQSEKRLG